MRSGQVIDWVEYWSCEITQRFDFFMTGNRFRNLPHTCRLRMTRPSEALLQLRLSCPPLFHPHTHPLAVPLGFRSGKRCHLEVLSFWHGPSTMDATQAARPRRKRLRVLHTEDESMDIDSSQASPERGTDASKTTANKPRDPSRVARRRLQNRRSAAAYRARRLAALKQAQAEVTMLRQQNQHLASQLQTAAADATQARRVAWHLYHQVRALVEVSNSRGGHGVCAPLQVPATHAHLSSIDANASSSLEHKLVAQSAPQSACFAGLQRMTVAAPSAPVPTGASATPAAADSMSLASLQRAYQALGGDAPQPSSMVTPSFGVSPSDMVPVSQSASMALPASLDPCDTGSDALLHDLNEDQLSLLFTSAVEQTADT